MSAKDGGPAFPGPFEHMSDVVQFAPDGQLVPPGDRVYMTGMSLRDWFAGMAMQGQMSMKGVHVDGEPLSIPKHATLLASTSYAMADAMLAARAK